MEAKKKQIVHVLFKISVIGKGVDGLLEIVGGILLFFTRPEQLFSFVRIVTQRELAEDPHDLIANYLLHAAQHLKAGVQIFGAIYLLAHGVIKAGLVAGLLWRKRWSYPAAMLTFLLFVIYQCYRYTDTRSPTLLLLSGIDLFVVVLTWLEYKRLLAERVFDCG